MWKNITIQSMLLVSTLAFSQQVVTVDLNSTIHQMTSPASNCNALSGGEKMPPKDLFFYPNFDKLDPLTCKEYIDEQPLLNAENYPWNTFGIKLNNSETDNIIYYKIKLSKNCEIIDGSLKPYWVLGNKEEERTADGKIKCRGLNESEKELFSPQKFEKFDREKYPRYFPSKTNYMQRFTFELPILTSKDMLEKTRPYEFEQPVVLEPYIGDDGNCHVQNSVGVRDARQYKTFVFKSIKPRQGKIKQKKTNKGKISEEYVYEKISIFQDIPKGEISYDPIEIDLTSNAKADKLSELYEEYQVTNNEELYKILKVKESKTHAIMRNVQTIHFPFVQLSISKKPYTYVKMNGVDVMAADALRATLPPLSEYDKNKLVFEMRTQKENARKTKSIAAPK